MKGLAVESANGSYDDPTDRASVQLEFAQLNDDINQIANTDFNGTVILNGGVMSDGLKAVDSKFVYTAAPVEKNREPRDIIGNYLKSGAVSDIDFEKAGQILDNSRYDLKAANKLWSTLRIKAADHDIGRRTQLSKVGKTDCLIMLSY